MSLTSKQFNVDIKKIMLPFQKLGVLYAITIDGYFIAATGVYGNENNILAFKTKELAQREITTFYDNKQNVKIKKMKVRTF